MVEPKGYSFLASPFKGTKEEKESRYTLSKKIAATFLQQGQSLFAPILYNEAVIDFFPEIEPADRCGLLMPMNLEFLHHSKAMILLKLKGWETSWGIRQYLNVCQEKNIPIYDLLPDEIDLNIEKLIHGLSLTSVK